MQSTLKAILLKRISKVAPGKRDFLKNLSIVTVCFAVSKIFSSISMIILARYLGPDILGEARVVLLVAQVLSVPMLFGLHASMMRYGTQEDNPAHEVATVTYLCGLICLIVAGVSWMLRPYLDRWIGISEHKMLWAIASAILLSGYSLLTSILQALHLVKQRGIIEILMAIFVLPGILSGYLFIGKQYETQLLAFGIGYGLSIPVMLWRFRYMMSPSWLFSKHTLMMLKYGGVTALGNIAFLVIFVVQPLQIQHALNERDVGFFSVYSTGSIAMATLATGIFYTVFFPKVARSENKQLIWKSLTSAWLKAAFPMFLLYCIIQVVTIWPLGKAYPLRLEWVLLFGSASVLITIHSTYAQILTSEGLSGTAWNMILSFVSAGINFSLSYLWIPKYGIPGAVGVLVLNFALTLVATYLIGKSLIVNRSNPVTEL